MPPVQRSKGPLILLIVLGSLFLLCVVGLGALYFFGRSVLRAAMPAAGCAISVEAIQHAVQDYAREHDGKLPQAATWQDDVKKYVKIDPEIKDLDGSPLEMKPITADGEWSCTGKNGVKTGIAFNDELSGKKLADIKDPRTTMMVFETEKVGRNVHEKYVEKPESTSPTILGAPRGWVKAPVEGEVKLGEKGDFDFKVKTKS